MSAEQLAWVRSAETVGPDYAALRPMRPSPTSPTFPVYQGLTQQLLDAEDPDDVVRHVLAVLSGYAYSEADTVTTMLTRLGMERSRCVEVSQVVDAMFICSTAYVVQSEDGRVVVVCYRGTEPANVINWLTDTDVGPESWLIDLDAASGAEDYVVHAGFYRNVRATRYAVVELLQRALAGQSILTADGDEVRVEPVQAIYVTGHSLGAAMAALLSVMIRTSPDYAALAAVLKATYTYGQPMIGAPALAEACSPLADRFLRYVYADDVVPQLPPRESGDFAHFGREFRCSRGAGRGRPLWVEARAPTGQTGVLGLAVGGLSLVTRELRRLRGLPLRQSILDHGPQNYIAALTPDGVRSEFGD